ncbi:MAG: STAS domain-containing protein [Methylacidiphilaceae bacterium]|nr:STAS domain-containing protein [Candidatus Methylacidiphilaceae bacterium]
MSAVFGSGQQPGSTGLTGVTAPAQAGRGRRVEIDRGQTGWVARVSSALDAVAAQELRGLVPETAAAGRLLLDCRKVEYATSAGLQALLDLAARLRSRGGSLALRTEAGALRETIRLTGIDRLPGVSPSSDGQAP